jgi:hypothetical protein
MVHGGTTKVFNRCAVVSLCSLCETKHRKAETAITIMNLNIILSYIVDRKENAEAQRINFASLRLRCDLREKQASNFIISFTTSPSFLTAKNIQSTQSQTPTHRPLP